MLVALTSNCADGSGVVVPITNVPPIVVLPVPSATVNLSVSIVKPPLRLAAPVNVVAPVTANVPPSVVAPVPTVNVLPAATVTLSFNVVAPVTANVPPSVVAPDAANDVNDPVLAVDEPTGVFCILPA